MTLCLLKEKQRHYFIRLDALKFCKSSLDIEPQPHCVAMVNIICNKIGKSIEQEKKKSSKSI
jgi:hypothetical protein